MFMYATLFSFFSLKSCTDPLHECQYHSSQPQRWPYLVRHAMHRFSLWLSPCLAPRPSTPYSTTLTRSQIFYLHWCLDSYLVWVKFSCAAFILGWLPQGRLTQTHTWNWSDWTVLKVATQQSRQSHSSSTINKASTVLQQQRTASFVAFSLHTKKSPSHGLLMTFSMSPTAKYIF